MTSVLAVKQSADPLVKGLSEGGPDCAAEQAWSLLRSGGMGGCTYWDRVRISTCQRLWSPTQKTTRHDATAALPVQIGSHATG